MATVTYKLTLSITEPNNNVGLIKIRQEDIQTQRFVAEIIEGGLIKSFRGTEVFFVNSTKLAEGMPIERKVTVTYPDDGRVEYTLDSQDLQFLGENTAYFSFRNKEGKQLYSTRDFHFRVLPGLLTGIVKDGPYVWQFEDLKRFLREYIVDGTSAWEQFVEQNKNIIESVDPGGTVLARQGVFDDFRKWDYSLIEKMRNEFAERAINVKWLGAKGDGVSDDTEAIQKAFDLSKESESLTRIIIPRGTYKVTKTLSIFNNTEVVAAGATVMRNHEGHILMNGIAGESYSAYNGHSNITITGGTWDGNVANYHMSGFAGLCFIHAENITIKDLTIKDIMSAHAIDLAGVKNCLIDNVTFQGYLPHTNPASVRNYVEAIQIEMCVEDSWDVFGAQDGTPCEDIYINNIHFVESPTEGTEIWRVGIGHHGAVDGIYTNNVTVTNTTFYKQVYGGIRAFKWNNTFIKNCTFNQCGKGVIMNGVEGGTNDSKDLNGVQTNRSQAGMNHTIENCVFIDCSDTPLYANGFTTNNEAFVDGIRVLNCEFIDCKNMLYLKMAKNITFLNCRFYNFETHAIMYSLSSNAVIENCYFEKMNGIAVKGAGNTTSGYLKNIFVKNSHFKDVKLNAISLSGVENFYISDCVVMESSAGEEIDAITIFGGSLKGKIKDNIIIKTGEEGRTGVFVSTVCRDISVTNNSISGYTNETYLPGGEESIYAGSLTSLRNGDTVYPDTNWQTPTVFSGLSVPSNKPNRCRRVGNVCELNTCITGVNSTSTQLVTIPKEVSPSTTLVTTMVSNSNKTARVQIGTNGVVTLINVTTGNSFDPKDEWSLSHNWLYD